MASEVDGVTLRPVTGRIYRGIVVSSIYYPASLCVSLTD
jgi:hypothetical protein